MENKAKALRGEISLTIFISTSPHRPLDFLSCTPETWRGENPTLEQGGELNNIIAAVFIEARLQLAP